MPPSLLGAARAAQWTDGAARAESRLFQDSAAEAHSGLRAAVRRLGLSGAGREIRSGLNIHAKRSPRAAARPVPVQTWQG